MRTVSKQCGFRRMALIVCLGLVAVGLVVTPAMAAKSKPYSLELGTELNIGELHIPVGKSQILLSPKPLQQLIIGNPGVADVKLLGEREVLILGKSPGTTNLAFRDKQKKVIALMDLVVGYDLDAIKRKLHEFLPGEEGIEVRTANDAIILTGHVSNAVAMDQALAIARSYVPKGENKDKVMNRLQVGGGQQVMLEVTIAEISRSARKDLDVGTDLTDGEFSLLTGSFGQVFGAASLDARLMFDSLNITLGALEEQKLAKILAEPKLIALSGEEASFLAGGEFAVPVDSDDDSITVEFKEFGVGLKFTPTVLSSSRINLKLHTEVSDFIEEQGTTINGIFVPGLATRRASTTVELGDGESFMVAGLLENNLDNAIEQFPGLGDIPVLGTLFRSPGYKRDETELVIAVTPRLVKPASADAMAYPTDGFVPPSDIDEFFHGRLEGDAPAAGVAAPTASGIEGAYGHQL